MKYSRYVILPVVTIVMVVVVFKLVNKELPNAGDDMLWFKQDKKVLDKPVAATVLSRTQKLNEVAEQFKKVGVRRCLGRIEQVTNFLTSGSDASSGFLFIPPTQQDNSFLSASLEVANPSVFSYVSANFHPREEQCAGEYETVTYWPNSCSELAAGRYAKVPISGKLQSKIIVLDGGPNMRVFLMPAQNGCVAIKKEVIY